MFKKSASKHLNLLNVYNRVERIIEEIPVIKERRRSKKILKLFRFTAFLILALFLAVIVFLGYEFFVLKNVYSLALEGKHDLENSVNLARNEDFSEALVFSNRAHDKFSLANKSVEKARKNFIVSHSETLRSQMNDIEALVTTADILSRAVGRGFDFAGEVKNLLETDKKISFSQFSTQEKKRVLGKFYESAPELFGISADLDLALYSLRQIKANGILLPLRSELRQLNKSIISAEDALNEAIPMSHILPILAGYPSKSAYLVLLQNSDELRPTGGFLGTYGILETENGEILRFDTHDIYHMDMPVKDKVNIDPPAPIKKYLTNKWYLRDANWSPDWPSSSRKISEFYKIEDALLPAKDKINNFAGEFNGVIGITPEFITDLLAITGPLEIKGEKYTKDNFSTLLEYKVEKDFIKLGTPSWQRKEIIGDIAKEIKIRLLDMPASRWKEIINAISENIEKKNILVFLNDSEIENLVKEQGWGGEIKDVESDYLMVVDANMGSFKTDSVMSKSVSYGLRETGQGLIAKVSINYAHNGRMDWRTTTYNTYTRIFVPEGSQLISAKGMQGEAEVKDELGKTSFGAFISIKPGEIGNLIFEYKLPNRLAAKINEGNYDLYLQKQAGNDLTPLTVDLSFSNEIESYSPTGFYVKKESANKVGWETDFLTDKKFQIILKP